MATRMQQRRGTAAQWTSADPILAAGEIGFETDTGEFRLGDGTNHWSDLSPFKNIVDLGGNLDDYVPLTTVGAIDGVASLDSAANVPASQLDNVIGNASTDFNTLGKLEFELLDNAGSNHAKINEIANTLVSAAVEEQATAQNEALGSAITQEVSDRNLAISSAVDTAIGTHSADTTSVHGIADTTALATKTYADNAVSTHDVDTTNVHGISNTADLVLTTDSRLSDTRTPSDLSVTEGKIADGAVTSAKIANGTIVAGDIADGAVTSAKILDGTIVNADINDSAAIAQSKVSNLTSDLAAKAPLASPTFTGTVNAATVTISGNLTVQGTTTTQNTTSIEVSDPLIYIGTGNTGNASDLGFVGHFDNGTYQHTGMLRDHTDGKWKLFSGVTTEPGASTVDLTGATYDTIKVGAVESVNLTATGTITASSSGVAFTDGTQVKQGVPSLTAINQQAGAYTTVLTDRDKLVEVSSASGVTVTIPANSSVAYPVGTSIDILQTGSGQVTIAGAGGVTVNATPGLKLRTQWSSATLFKRATDTWVVFGDLSA